MKWAELCGKGEKWAGSVSVRGGFEFLCKFDALRRVIPEPFRQTKRSRTTHIPAPNLTVIPRQTERGKGKELKGVWERGGEDW